MEMKVHERELTRQYTVYTDGGCWPNPGPGGWAAIIMEGKDRVAVLTGNDHQTTNNRMEVKAAIEAVRILRPVLNGEQFEFVLFTDSQYLQRGIMQWSRKWKQKRFNNVKNADLWQELLLLLDGLNYAFEWVRGHDGNPLNEECDRLASTELKKNSSCG